MKTIYIVRHAKSSWKYKSIEDQDRPLKERGILDAHLVSKHLNEIVARPDAFLTSHATRALCTAVIFCQNMKFPLPNLKINKSLYSFSDKYLVKTIRALDNDFETAMIFSHDHGINDFVNRYGTINIEHIPTCGVVAIQFNVKYWKDIKKGDTTLFCSPKELKNTYAED
ncbi:MAG: SixA phosphatase family protein [Flavobacteriaceae bacterium]